MDERLFHKFDNKTEKKTSQRNVKTGDIVLIQDSNSIRGQWKLGKVSNTYPGTDGKVRKVYVQYKNLNADEPTAKYKGKGYVTVQRPVQRLILLLPKESEGTEREAQGVGRDMLCPRKLFLDERKSLF